MTEKYKVIENDDNYAVLKSDIATFRIFSNCLMSVEFPDMSPIDELRLSCTFPTDMGEIKVDYIGFDSSRLFEQNVHINRVVLEDDVRHVTTGAFKKANIDEIVWSPSCKLVPWYCFKDSNIKRISGIENVVKVDSHAFYGSKIEELDWPKGADNIPKYCFSSCKNLKKVSGLEHVAVVGEDAFSKAVSIERLEFGDELKEIQKSAFEGCTKLSSVQWGNSLEKIGKRAFYWAALSDMGPTQSIKFIGVFAFGHCPLKSFAWPQKCKAIKESTFRGCPELASLTGYENVSNIGSSAFASCRELKEFTVPQKVSKIPRRCFKGAGIRKINNLDHVSYIGDYAFADSNLTGTFKWPSNCHVIESHVFEECESLEEVTNLDSVQAIKAQAFADSGIKRLDLSASVCSYIGDRAFGFINPQNITLPYYTLGESENYF